MDGDLGGVRLHRGPLRVYPTDLLTLISLPVGTDPFHFIATGTAASQGPYSMMPGFAFEAVCCDVTGGVLLSPVIRFTVL